MPEDGNVIKDRCDKNELLLRDFPCGVPLLILSQASGSRPDVDTGSLTSLISGFVVFGGESTENLDTDEIWKSIKVYLNKVFLRLETH